ncbi:hypothetical protein A2U01_0110717, partial [Trifolium medium]|nr:hypothetical protein [Trifolium medium]
GADLANMVNHAALAAATDGAKAVTSHHMFSAKDQIRMTKGYLKYNDYIDEMEYDE